MIKEEGKFKWLEEGTKGQPIILLHGLMGGVENFGEMAVSYTHLRAHET